MNQVTKIEKLLLTRQKVFSLQDISVLWQIQDRRKLLEIIKYYLRTGKLKALRRGLYVIDDSYSKFEIAQKTIPLSYISLYTALAKYGISFQVYVDIHCVSLASRFITVDNVNYRYHKISSEIFLNSMGIIKENNYMIASPERAVCDTLYFYPKSAFDELSMLSKDKLLETVMIYNNKSLVLKVKKMIKDYL